VDYSSVKGVDYSSDRTAVNNVHFSIEKTDDRTAVNNADYSSVKGVDYSSDYVVHDYSIYASDYVVHDLLYKGYLQYPEP